MLQLAVIVIAVILLGWLAAWMLSQKPVTNAQQLIQQHRYEDAVAAAANDPLHRAEALKLLGRFDEAVVALVRERVAAIRQAARTIPPRAKESRSLSRTSAAISMSPNA